MERSAEFYRGEVAALNRAQRDFTITVPELQAEDVALLAEAEAREALQGSKEKMALSRIYDIASRQLAEPAGMGDAVAMAKICTEVEAVHLTREASVPTAAEVIAAAERALELCGPCDESITMEEILFAERLRIDALAAIAKYKEARNA